MGKSGRVIQTVLPKIGIIKSLSVATVDILCNEPEVIDHVLLLFEIFWKRRHATAFCTNYGRLWWGFPCRMPG